MTTQADMSARSSFHLKCKMLAHLCETLAIYHKMGLESFLDVKIGDPGQEYDYLQFCGDDLPTVVHATDGSFLCYVYGMVNIHDIHEMHLSGELL